MKRREFFTLLGSVVAAWPLAARAQQARRLPTIGFLGSGTAAALGGWTAAFVKRLRELGWIEGRTVAIEYRWAEGRNEYSAEFAAEFVRLNVDAIVTVGTPTTVAATHATSIIPIVFVAAGDPVNTGLVASLARPGANVTGVSNQQSDVAAKRLGLLREVVPGLSRLAIIGNTENSVTAQEMGEVENAARTLGLAVSTLEIRRATDISPAFEELKSVVDALYVCTDGLTIGNRVRINTLALVARLPTMHGNREQLEGGGLISYGANNFVVYQRAADYVDKILRGAQPADIPVEQPTKFDLAINLITAKALGLEIPDRLLAIADEVIE
jgi:putative tryptophan/tyrosine transport system substrate-binding protein